jgi:hypothetical protein
MVQGCGTQPMHDETFAVGADHALGNVVVYLVGVSGATKPAARDITLDQKDCRFVPHVQVTTVGSKVTVKNSDATLHTAHLRSGTQTLINEATPGGLTSPPHAITSAGPVSVSCDAGHTWMSAWIYVFDQPYFVMSGADGKFSLPSVPPGTYTLKAWHEKLGERTTKVTVTAGKPTHVELEFKTNGK